MSIARFSLFYFGSALREDVNVCSEHEISEAAYYQWKSKYGGMQASDLKRLREREEENRRLKQISADLLLKNRALKDVIAKKP